MAQLPQRGLQTYTVQEAQNAALGQLGSCFLDLAASTVEPTGDRCIIAITALTDVEFSHLESVKDKYDGQENWISTTGDGFADLGDTIDSANEIPRGVTIYGRWSKVSLNANGMQCICYIG